MVRPGGASGCQGESGLNMKPEEKGASLRVIFHKEVFKQISPIWKAPFKLKVKFYFRNQNPPSVGALRCERAVSQERVLSGQLFPARRPERPGQRHRPARRDSKEPLVSSLSLHSGREPRLPSCPAWICFSPHPVPGNRLLVIKNRS